MADLLVLLRPVEACINRMAQVLAENLEETSHAGKQRMASVSRNERLAKTPEPPSPKANETEPSV